MSKPIIRSVIVVALLAATAGAGWHFYGDKKPDVTVVEQPHSAQTAEVVEQLVERETEVLTPSKQTTEATDADISFFDTQEGRIVTHKLIVADLQTVLTDWVEKSGGWHKFLSLTIDEQKIVIDRICRKYPLLVDAQYKQIKTVYFDPRIGRARELMAQATANEGNRQVLNTIEEEMRILNNEVGKSARDFLAAFSKSMDINASEIITHSRHEENSMKDQILVEVSDLIYGTIGLEKLGKSSEITDDEKKLFDAAGGGKSGFNAIVKSRIDALYEKGIAIAKLVGVPAAKPVINEDNKDKTPVAIFHTWKSELITRLRKCIKSFKDESSEKRKIAADKVRLATVEEIEKFKADYPQVNYHQWQLDTIKLEGVPVEIPKPKTDFSGFVGWYLWYLQNHVGPTKLAKLDPKSPEYEALETEYLRFDKDQRYKSRVKALFELRADQMAKVKKAYDDRKKKLNDAVAELKERLQKEGVVKIDAAGASNAPIDERDIKTLNENDINVAIYECGKEIEKSAKHAFEALRKALHARLEVISKTISGDGKNAGSLCPNLAAINEIREEINRNLKEIRGMK